MGPLARVAQCSSLPRRPRPPRSTMGRPGARAPRADSGLGPPRAGGLSGADVCGGRAYCEKPKRTWRLRPWPSSGAGGIALLRAGWYRSHFGPRYTSGRLATRPIRRALPRLLPTRWRAPTCARLRPAGPGTRAYALTRRCAPAAARASARTRAWARKLGTHARAPPPLASPRGLSSARPALARARRRHDPRAPARSGRRGGRGETPHRQKK